MDRPRWADTDRQTNRQTDQQAGREGGSRIPLYEVTSGDGLPLAPVIRAGFRFRLGNFSQSQAWDAVAATTFEGSVAGPSDAAIRMTSPAAELRPWTTQSDPLAVITQGPVV